MAEKTGHRRVPVFFDKRLDLGCHFCTGRQMRFGMKKHLSIIAAILLASSLYSQNSVGVKYMPVKMELPHFGQMIAPLPYSLSSSMQSDPGPKQLYYSKSPSILASAYKYEDLALFCRLEVQMEKAARFPVKFRLGEVQYVDRMEGKQ